MHKFMQKLTLGIAAATLAVGAQAMLIDDFSVDQALIQDIVTGPPGQWAIQAGPSASIIGGYRDLFVIETLGPNPNLGIQMDVFGGVLSFSSAATEAGAGIIRWDGLASNTTATDLAGAITSIDHTGLGGLDLASAGLGFLIHVLSSDAGFPFTLQAFTNAYRWSVATDTALAGPNIYFVPFGAFAPMGSLGGVDWANIGALQAIINYGLIPNPNYPGEGQPEKIFGAGNVTDVDLTITLARVVPEPASIALVGMALLAAGVASRRRLS
jgi:hypothetical protein